MAEVTLTVRSGDMKGLAELEQALRPLTVYRDLSTDSTVFAGARIRTKLCNFALVMAPRPIDAVIMVLRDMEHLSIAETSQILGISKDLVKTRLLRARLQMREALAPGYDGSWSMALMEYKRVRPW